MGQQRRGAAIRDSQAPPNGSAAAAFGAAAAALSLPQPRAVPPPRSYAIGVHRLALNLWLRGRLGP